jgi:hypothetical protein
MEFSQAAWGPGMNHPQEARATFKVASIHRVYGDFDTLSPFVYNSLRSRISMKPVVAVLRKNISGRELFRSVGI